MDEHNHIDDEDDELTEEIKAQVEEWSSNSNDCTMIQLVRNVGSNNVVAKFQPDFTYPIFGDEEAIFGYRGLNIAVTFAAHDMRPYVSITHDEVFPVQGNVRPTDIEEALRVYLPDYPDLFIDYTLREEVPDDATAFRPPGECVHTYERRGEEAETERYEVWCCSLADAAARQVLQNMQILVPMFIEGGTTLQLEQDWTTQRWKLFLLYQVVPPTATVPGSPYQLVGYGTSYRVFTLPGRQKPSPSDLDVFSVSSQTIEAFLPPPSSTTLADSSASSPPSDAPKTPLDLPCRERLSQFLILPPFQKCGHGQELYNSMYTALTAFPNVREFTVEDPNEAFDDLRDYCDLRHLRSHNPDFTALRINTNIAADRLKGETEIPTDLIVSGAARARIVQQTKIDLRQFNRLVEMHTLSFIPPHHRSKSRLTKKTNSSSEHDRAYYFWRLYAKQRLYVFNRDQLIQLERAERIEKLEATLDSVQEAYGKMVERVEAAEKQDGHARGGAMEEEQVFAARPRKRKVVEDEEDEEEDDEGGKVVLNGAKKVRVENGE